MDLTKLRQKTLVKAVAMKNAAKNLNQYSQSYYDKITAIADALVSNNPSINAGARIEAWFSAAHSGEDAETYEPTTDDIETIALISPGDKLPAIQSIDLRNIKVPMPTKDIDSITYQRYLCVDDWRVDSFKDELMHTDVIVKHYNPYGIEVTSLQKSATLETDSDALPPPYDQAVPNEFKYVVNRILGSNENIVSVMTEMITMAIPVVESKITYP